MTKVTKKGVSKEDIRKYKELIKGGLWEYLLTQGGKMGLLFGGIIFLMDYAVWQDVKGAGTYLFYIIFCGFLWGLWGWHLMKKEIKQSR